MTGHALDLSAADLADLSARGIAGAEAERQRALLAAPPKRLRLARPATLGDGILRLDASAEATAVRAVAYADAAERQRISRFVPASGAASRMFADLERLAREESKISSDRELQRLLDRFRDGLERWPFAVGDDSIGRHGREEFSEPPGAPRPEHGLSQRERELLDGWLGPEGLARRAKGLLPFHRIEGRPFTAVQEHLYEAAALATAAGLEDAAARVHFTVSTEHLARFDTSLATWSEEIGRVAGCSLHYELSDQAPGTRTLSLAGGALARDASGRLLLRPGGHGALLHNLQACGDIVVVKNIDNVLPHDRQAASVAVQEQLIGHAVLLQRRIFEVIGDLRARGASAHDLQRANNLADELGLPSNARTLRDAIALLDRPSRICGMVRNEGEPGGGPFWVERPGSPLQIVESAQIDRTDPGQREIADRATHFNPVLLVCALQDADGKPFELDRFSDPTTSFVSKKDETGLRLTVLEHPGLWNGAMADWITVFVEIPVEVFAPVKTVWDLLSRRHQPAGDNATPGHPPAQLEPG